MIEIEAREGQTITRITFPGEAPELYQRPAFGCRVIRGDRFTVRLADGRLIEP